MASARERGTATRWQADDPPWSVIDIQAELAYWQEQHAHGGACLPDLPFRQCVPTLKFAYDAYLLSQGRPLESLQPPLSARYRTHVPPAQRLPWPAAHDLVAAVWRRLRAPIYERQLVLSLPHDARREQALVEAARR